MKSQNLVKKRFILIVMLITIAGLMVMGCSQKPARVYKIAYPLKSNSSTQSVYMQQERPYNLQESYQTTKSVPEQNTREQFQRQQDFNFHAVLNNAETQQMNQTHQTQLAHHTPTKDYHIGPGDVLQVKIYQLLELDQEAVLAVEVDRNGQIYLPILNQVTVAQMTIDQVRDELIRRLGREYIRDPQVHVSIKTYNSKKVMVLGQVSNPGPLALETDTSTLLDVIARSGGIGVGAAPEIEILRGAYNPDGTLTAGTSIINQSYTRELVPVSKLFAEEGAGRINPPIFAGDVIKVRPADEGYVYFSGEVEHPGPKTFRRPLTILQGISCAGGITNIAADKKCKIIRRNPNGTEKEIVVDLEKIRDGEHENLVLARNDTIVIPVHPVKKFFNDLDQLVRRGVNTGVNMTYNASEEMGIPSGGTWGGYGY